VGEEAASHGLKGKVVFGFIGSFYCHEVGPSIESSRRYRRR
jgi:hypothetical protein